MSDAPLYNLREMARVLDLPESTVRYYRDAFAEHIATVGTGRRRRYPEDALATLRSIADGYAKGRTREEIDAELFGGPTPTRTRPPARMSALQSEELLATVLDGERERREAMWQMARELVRLGEAVERQHLMLGDFAEQLTKQVSRTLPAGESAPVAPPPPPQAEGAEEPPAPEPRAAAAELAEELATLQRELTAERELVERLRKSRLAIERRAAEAEARLEEAPPTRSRSVLGRLLSREPGDAEGG
jgi:DNA-binding transcriptional MerR regulator